MARSSRNRVTVLVVMMAAAVLQSMVHGAPAQTCSGMYRKAGKPLLFGGVGEPNRCLKNCQSRTDFCKSVGVSSSGGGHMVKTDLSVLRVSSHWQIVDCKKR